MEESYDSVENKENAMEDIPSSESSDLGFSESNYESLIQQTEYINQKMDNVTNVLIFCMIGIGILVGVLCNNIFSRYFKS